MRLLYTISKGFNEPQSNYTNSLGGFISSTQVPNDTFDNIFDELSLFEIKEGLSQYRAIVLQNDSNEEARDVELWLDYDKENLCSYQIAAVIMNVNENNEYYMESIPNSHSKPTQVRFYDATEEDKASIGNLAPGRSIGLWLARTINRDRAIADYNNVCERNLSTASRYKPIVKETEERFDLKISWT